MEAEANQAHLQRSHSGSLVKQVFSLGPALSLLDSVASPARSGKTGLQVSVCVTTTPSGSLEGLNPTPHSAGFSLTAGAETGSFLFCLRSGDKGTDHLETARSLCLSWGIREKSPVCCLTSPAQSARDFRGYPAGAHYQGATAAMQRGCAGAGSPRWPSPAAGAGSPCASRGRAGPGCMHSSSPAGWFRLRATGLR